MDFVAQDANILLRRPSQRGGRNSEKTQVPSATQPAHSRALCERGGCEGQEAAEGVSRRVAE